MSEADSRFWLRGFWRSMLAVGEFPAYERAVYWARGQSILAPRVDPIPLHNRVLPTQRDLCRLWQLSCGEGRYA